jgi:hypothetical protein
METTLQANKGRYDGLGPLGASLLFHALLIAVLNSTSSFDFTVGNETRFDILWFAAADLASPSTRGVKELASAAAPPAPQPADSREDQEDPDPSSRNVPVETVPEDSESSATPAMEVTGALALAIPAAAKSKRHNAARRPAQAAHLKSREFFPAAPPITASQSREQEKRKHETPLPGQPEITKKPEKSASGTLADSSSTAEEKERAKRAKAANRPGLETTAAPKEQASPPQLEVFQILPAAPARPISAGAVRPEPPADTAAGGAARVVTTPAPEAARNTAAKAKVQAAPQVTPPPAPFVKIAAAAKPPAPQLAKAPAPKAVKSAAPAPTTPTAAAPQATVKSQRPWVAAKAAAPRAATSAATSAKAPAAGHPPMVAKAVAAPAPTVVPPLPAPPAAKKAVEKADGKAAGTYHEGGKGILLSSLQGDLKLVLAGDQALRLTVWFREFAKSHRSRTQSKAEARNLKRVQPIIAKSGQQTREAVIGTAREGIYIFTVESEHAAPAQGNFTLKLYESAAREKLIRIGTRTVSSRTIIARVLMPEGILWEDDSAFSGSMEDSDSTTKFNTQTGLYWKEYND